MTYSQIPYLDLQPLNNRFKEQDNDVFEKIHNSGQFIGGKWVKIFEDNFAAFCGVQFCIGTGNGLDALTIILKSEVALGNLPKNARILVPAHTYIATFLSVIHAGLRPIPIDVERLTLTASILKKSTLSYDAIVAVDIYGKLVEDEVYAFAKENNLNIYCDTAQSHGASNSDGLRSGNIAKASAFSFYPTKNLGALGDAGAITTNDVNLAMMCRKIANYGRESRFRNDVIGVNSRLDPLQAGFLLNRLPLLENDNKRRIDIANLYYQKLNNDKVKLHDSSFLNNNAMHVFPVYVDNRRVFMDYLDHIAIGTSIHYEVPPHLQNALSQFNELSFPVTEELHRTEVSLPCHPLLEDEEVERIIRAVNAY